MSRRRFSSAATAGLAPSGSPPATATGIPYSCATWTITSRYGSRSRACRASSSGCSGWRTSSAFSQRSAARTSAARSVASICVTADCESATGTGTAAKSAARRACKAPPGRRAGTSAASAQAADGSGRAGTPRRASASRTRPSGRPPRRPVAWGGGTVSATTTRPSEAANAVSSAASSGVNASKPSTITRGSVAPGAGAPSRSAVTACQPKPSSSSQPFSARWRR